VPPASGAVPRERKVLSLRKNGAKVERPTPAPVSKEEGNPSRLPTTAHASRLEIGREDGGLDNRDRPGAAIVTPYCEKSPSDRAQHAEMQVARPRASPARRAGERGGRPDDPAVPASLAVTRPRRAAAADRLEPVRFLDQPAPRPAHDSGTRARQAAEPIRGSRRPATRDDLGLGLDRTRSRTAAHFEIGDRLRIRAAYIHG